jgi:AMP-polyphosphate phosphotransferase
MFETAELGQTVPNGEFARREPKLRDALLQAQFELGETNVPVLIVFGGVDGAGKGESANVLTAWMDARGIRTRAYDKPTDIEREKPAQWRYWRDLPAGGSIGIFLSAWYSGPFMKRVDEGITPAEFERELDHIRAMERTWADDGAVILKFWMHLGKAQQKARFETLEADPLQAWRVTEKDWANWERYDRFLGTAEELIARTSTGYAPWNIIEGTDANFRTLEVSELVLAGLKRGVQSAKAQPSAESVAGPEPVIPGQRTILSSVNLSAKVPKAEYNERLPELQGRLNTAYRAMCSMGRSAVVVFEGWDAGGKGGAIRRLMPAFDARHVEVHQIAAPTKEELSRHYLWRFWKRIPRAGEIGIFDRSWYGRVLVERVEGFATDIEWRRAYTEINDFEHRLIEHGMTIVKFWLHVSPEEQKKRFLARQKISYKKYKLTDEDWRNRDRWEAYETSVHEMVERTSSASAPWCLVPGNDKRYARLMVLETLCETLENRLDLSAPKTSSAD